jgi:WD40 repeat protein
MPIIKGALHVYYSALVTMPSCLLLEETAPHDGHGVPLLVTKRAAGWGFREMILDESGTVMCIAYSPNGKLIASVSLDEVVRVWDLATGTALHAISVPDRKAINPHYCDPSIAFSPNSQWIVSNSRDCTVRLWDVVTGSLHRVMRGHTSLVTCVAFSPDGTIIASSSNDCTLRIWNVGTGDEQLMMTGHTAAVNSVAFAPNGQIIVSASDDCTLRVWDIPTGTQLHVMEGDKGHLNCVAFSPDGVTIALGSSNGSIELWSAANSTRQHALEGRKRSVRSLTFSPDSRSLISCDGKRFTRIWDVTTGIEKRSLPDGVTAVAYSPDGNSIAMGLVTDTIRIWDANTRVLGHQAHNYSVTFSPDGLLIASGFSDQTVRIWDVITGIEQDIMQIGDVVCSTAFSPDNRTIVCGQRNGTVHVWNVASGQKCCSMMGQHVHKVDAVAFSSDGRSLVSFSFWEGMARVWDAATGTQQRILTIPAGATGNIFGIGTIAFSADGKSIAVLEDDERDVAIGLWDLTTAQSEYTPSMSPHKQTPAFDDLHTSKQHRFGGHHSAWIRHRIRQEEPRYICWLPQERRGRLVYNGMKVCIVGEDGTITILDFSPVDIL